MLKKMTHSLHSQGHLYESKRNWLAWNLNTARCFHLSGTLPTQLFEISTSSNILLQVNSLVILNSNFSQSSFCDIRPKKKKKSLYYLVAFCNYDFDCFANSLQHLSIRNFWCLLNKFTKYFSLFRTCLKVLNICNEKTI